MQTELDENEDGGMEMLAWAIGLTALCVLIGFAVVGVVA